MSKTTLMNNISRSKKELSDITKKISQETKKENDASKRILQIEKSITKNTSPSLINSKLSEIHRKQGDISKILDKKSTLQKKEADITAKLHKNQIALQKEEERERKKLEIAEKKNQNEQVNFQRKLRLEIESTKALTSKFQEGIQYNVLENVKYDIFISHASEDKDDLVRPLVQELEKLGVKVWYDEFTLKVGDSLRKSIDQGLANSRYGTVVLSSSFFSKNWPQYELDGMVAKEMHGHKMILPIWHKVSKDEVINFSPTLADKVALNSSMNSINEIALQLAEVIKG